MIGGTTDTAAAAGPPTTDRATSTGIIPVSVESLAGIWTVDTQSSRGQVRPTQGLLWALGQDGTFAFDDRGTIDIDPFVSGTYELVADVFDPNVDRGECTTVPPRSLALPEDGRLRVVFTEDGSGYRGARAGDEWTAIRLSPASAAGSALVPAFSGEGDTLPPSRAAMTGIWLRAGSGQLISFRPNGTYAIDDGQLGAPDDTGIYKIDGRTIGFTSFAPDAACAWRSSRSWDAVALQPTRLNQQHDTQAMALHTQAAQSDCPIHMGGGNQTWLKLSPT